MSYQVLARKWRPKTFSEVVGQPHVVRALTNALEQQRLHHAYLFTGTRGVGKTTLARILAKALNCETGITPTPCGQCAACREIDGGRFIDLLELDAASNTGIDNMREVLDNAQYAPVAGRFKVYIIDEVHMLSRAAFNSMLKTLEEPPAHVKFVLATTDPQKIPVTVLSRCLQFNLKHLPPVEIDGRLREVLAQEAIAFEPAALVLIARAAQGSMRDALSLLDQAVAFGGGRVEEAQVNDMLGTIDQDYLFGVLEALARQDGAALVAAAEAMESRGLSFDGALQELAALLYRVTLAQTVPDALDEALPEKPRLMALAAEFTPEDVQLFYQIALHGRRDLALAPDEFAGFSMTLLRMLAFTLDAQDIAPPFPVHPAIPAQRVATPPPSAPPPSATPSAAAPLKEMRAGFDGDWGALIERLKLSGMTRMLAQHCEVAEYTDQHLALCVPEVHRHLLDTGFQEKLAAALRDHFGARKVTFRVGEVTGMTPAVLRQQEKAARQSGAVAAIEQDAFVRDLVEHFDARLVESSIKPTE